MIVTAPPIHYSLFGLRVQSDFHLPTSPIHDAVGADADVQLVWGDPSCALASPSGTPLMELRCHCPEHHGQVIMRIHRSMGHVWIWHTTVGTCHIDPAGRVVSVYPDPMEQVNDQTLGLVLAGIAFTFVLHLRGYPCLHASSVSLPGGAIAFLGPKGHGKSTMAASFLQRGGALLTDDVLAVEARSDGVFGVPSMPLMKVMDGTAEHTLHLRDALPNLAPGVDKKLFRLGDGFRFANRPQRLRALYILDRYEPRDGKSATIEISRPSPREALLALLAQTTLGPWLTPAEIARAMPTYQALLKQAPLRVVRFPNGFQHQEMVSQRILADVKDATWLD